MRFETDRLLLRTLEASDLPILKDYLVRNRPFLSEWEPIRTEEHFKDETLMGIIQNEAIGNENKTLLSLYLFPRDEEKIIGNVVLSNIVRGPFQSCFLGYKLDEMAINKGFITEAVKKVIEIAFETYELHRIEASIMPKNIRSIRVVEKLGFEYEGLSKKYLKINGEWEDHAHYAILNSNI